jgi:2-ketocyclohexanecarboxyl-CoA hydrolase
MGPVHKAIPAAKLDDPVNPETDILAERSPTALALAKRSFNADSDNIRGISMPSLNAVKHYHDGEDSKEAMRAFQGRRAPDSQYYVK